jgi:sulfur-oxidizing protein SoxY
MRKKMQRRDFMRLISGAFAFSFIAPMNAFAALWNKTAFETTLLKEAEKSLEINGEKLSQDILITVPDKAENGAIVQVEVKSNIPNTETISILVEKNPTPLIAHFKFSNGAEPFMVTRIKMAETSDVKVVVKAGNQYFTNAKNVVVLENGCG